MSCLGDSRVLRILLGNTKNKGLTGQSVTVEASSCGLRYNSREALIGKCSDKEFSGQGRASRVMLRMQNFPLLACSDLGTEGGADVGKCSLQISEDICSLLPISWVIIPTDSPFSSPLRCRVFAVESCG